MRNKLHIFLDIDDVLTTTRQYHLNPKHWNKVYNRYLFDKKCVNVFNRILSEIDDCVVILSSDWRVHYSLEMMNTIFEINNVQCTITDFTENLWRVKFTSPAQISDCRADEILKYVHEHCVENWLVIDDLDLSPWIDNDHFVRTPRPNEGIKQKGKDIEILDIVQNKIK